MSDFLGQANFEEGDEDLRRAIELSLDGVHLDSSTNPSSADNDSASTTLATEQLNSNHLQDEQASSSNNSLIGTSECVAFYSEPRLPTQWELLLGPSDITRKSSRDTIHILLELIDRGLQAPLDRGPGDFSSLNPGRRMESTRAAALVFSGLHVLFGSPLTLTADELKRWWQSCFKFSSYGGFFGFGLIQDYSGPCGVLATLQSWVFVYLLLHPSRVFTQLAGHLGRLAGRRVSDGSRIPESNFPNESRHSDSPDAGFQNPTPLDLEDICVTLKLDALAWALSLCLYRCTPSSQYYLVELSSVEPTLEFSSQTSIFLEDFAAQLTARVTVYSSIQSIYRVLRRNMISDGNLAPASLLSYVLSVVVTRGERTTRRDMDDASLPLIGLYGHCSQELVNILITGEAVSNVFDGDRTLPEDTNNASEPVVLETSSSGAPGLHLRGVNRKQIVGYLTELEALRYCQVGHYLKFPAFPVWVVGRPNHFTSMLSTDFSACKLGSSEELVQSFCRVFDTIDSEGIGIVPARKLSRLLALCGKEYCQAIERLVSKKWMAQNYTLSLKQSLHMTKYYAEAKCILDPPGQGGAILRTEFLEWAKVKRHTELCEKKTDFQSTDRRQHASDALVSPRRRGTAKNATGWLPTPKGYVLYHYDGQNSTLPKLTRLIVEPTEKNDIAAVSNKDNANLSGLSSVLHTKWKYATITSETLG